MLAGFRPNLSGTGDRGRTELWRASPAAPCRAPGATQGERLARGRSQTLRSSGQRRQRTEPAYVSLSRSLLAGPPRAVWKSRRLVAAGPQTGRGAQRAGVWVNLARLEKTKREARSEVSAVEESLKRTPLYEAHRRLGARMVPFGGWEMPVQYTGVKEEHHAVRQRAGLFDVSHMGEFEVKGPQALDLIQYVITNNAKKLAVGQVQYALMCYDNGTVVDDVLVYRLGEEHYWVVVNAANIDKDWAWVSDARARRGFTDVELTNFSDQVAQLALQGPLAQQVLQRLVEGLDLNEVGFFWAKTDVTVAGVRTLVLSRTGYTGEDGFEIYCRAADAVTLWDAILEAGKEDGVLPCGLGARDTLRFEARLPLYGHEINDTITPYEAGLGFFVKTKKGVDFIGRDALIAQKEKGVERKLAGFEMIDRGIPRQGYEISKDGQVVGFVTTGSYSPTLEKNIGLAMVPVELAEVGAEFDVIIRGRALKAKVVPTPFYQPRYKK